MKIIIVEDEPKTRQGLIKIIEKYTMHEVIGSECDGKCGLERISLLRPDVVISDIQMPVMDGLTMLQKLRESGINTSAVLLTGYSEFEYARRAISLEVTDYILKPLDVEEIVMVLEKINNRLTSEKAKTVSEEQLLFSWLTCDESKKTMWEHQFKEKLLLQSKEPLSFFLVKTVSMLNETKNEIASILQDNLKAVCMSTYYVFRLPYERMLLVMILGGQNRHFLKEIFQMKILPEMNEVGRCIVCYGKAETLTDLPDQLAIMQEYFDYSFVMEENKVIDGEILSTFTFDEKPYPESLEHHMRKEMKSGSREQMERITGQFLDQIMDCNIRPRIIKEYTLRFLLAMLDAANGLKSDKDMEMLYRYVLSHIMESDSKENLTYQFIKVKNSVMNGTEHNSVTENGMVLTVIEFIRTNYYKDISLSEAAALVGITPEYLSKLFTKEMGINFSTFLGDFRVSMAKRLLAENRRKVYEVAEAVGYRDTKYFNKVFKSIVGVSPSEFRRIRS